MNEESLSEISMSIVTSIEDCALISTSIISALPTVSYEIIESIAIVSSTSESIVAVSSKRSFLSDSVDYDRTVIDRSMFERALSHVTSSFANYVQNLNLSWVNQVEDVSAQFFFYESMTHSAAGVNEIYECTSVIISSEKRIYISHI